MVPPRLLRLRDAPAYLGMNINYFNQVVRPHVVEIRIGSHGVAFDRFDLDAFAEGFKHSNQVLSDKADKKLSVSLAEDSFEHALAEAKALNQNKAH